MPKIILQKDGSIVNTFDFPGREEITVGSSSGCDVPIEDPALASEQAKIMLRKDGFYLQLVTHIPAVFVTGERVEGEVKLEDGDTINVEEYDLVLNVLDDELEKIADAEPRQEKPVETEEQEKTEDSQKSDEEISIEKDELKPEKLEEKPAEEQLESSTEKVPETGPEEKAEVKQDEDGPDVPDEKVQVEKTEEYRTPEEPEKSEDKPVKVEKAVDKAVEKEEPRKPTLEPRKPTIAPQKQEQPIESAEKVSDAPADSAHKTKVLDAGDTPDESAHKKPEPQPLEPDEENMWLVVISGPLQDHRFKLIKGPNRIGRDRQKNDIIVRLDRKGEVDTSISREHAVVDYTDGVFYLSDTKSQMRTRLNDRTISTDEVLPLKEGDLIEISSVRESTVFKFVSEKNIDAPVAKIKIDAISPEKLQRYLPYILVGVGLLVIILILILILK